MKEIKSPSINFLHVYSVLVLYNLKRHNKEAALASSNTFLLFSGLL